MQEKLKLKYLDGGNYMPSEVSSWAMSIKTPSELPEVFREAYDKIGQECEPSPLIYYKNFYYF